MRGQTRKVSKGKREVLNKLRRPDFFAGDVDASCPQPPDHAGTGTADGVVHTAPPAAADPLAVHYPTGNKTLFKRKAAEEEAASAMIQPLPQERIIRDQLRAQLIGMVGGPQNVTPIVHSQITSIVEMRVMLARGYKAVADHGQMRINRKTRMLQGQAIIKEQIIPLETNLRLAMKEFLNTVSLLGEGPRRRQGGDVPLCNGENYLVDSDEEIADGTPEGDMAVVNHLRLILGTPEQTPEEVMAEFREWGHKAKLEDGTLPPKPQGE